MKNYKTLVMVLTIACSSFCLSSIQAQTIAFVNSDEIVPEMPAYKRAESELEAYGKQLQRIIAQKEQEMINYLKIIQEKKDSLILTPKEAQEADIKLNKMREELQKAAKDAEKKLYEKEQGLLKPLYDEFNAAIKKVAKTNGYSYIIDKKMMLYTAGGIDATDKLKTELGISW